MDIVVVTEFIAKTTVKTWAFVYDENKELTDPTGADASIKVIITDPDGTVVVPSEGNGDDVMTNYDIAGEYQTGIYFHYYRTTTSSTKGNYHGEVVVIDGSGDTVVCSTGTFAFKVK